MERLLSKTYLPEDVPDIVGKLYVLFKVELDTLDKESIAKRMIKYLLFARSHEIWQREIL